jgi:hypothetical protein
LLNDPQLAPYLGVNSPFLWQNWQNQEVGEENRLWQVAPEMTTLVADPPGRDWGADYTTRLSFRWQSYKIVVTKVIHMRNHFNTRSTRDSLGRAASKKEAAM